MCKEQPSPAADEDQLDEAFAAYIEAIEAGCPLDRETFLSQYPALTEELAALECFDSLTEPVRETVSAAIGAPSEPITLPPGTRIGNYEILHEIGRHGQGVVYKARHTKFHEQIVALKMPLSSHRATEKEAERFIAEVENQAKLDHPNIVPIKGGGEHDGRLYFTMKLVEGGSLNQRPIERPIPSAQAADLIAKIARAVHHAHQRRILHRDLKPSNILVDGEGRPYVADFGLSKPMASNVPIDAGYVVGAPAYMPPEQVHGEATTLSDVYGLGAVFYWLLSGRPPFQADSREETLHQVLHEAPDPPRAICPQADRDLEAICLKCLEKEPDRRYRSAEGLAKDLERWMAGRQTSARKWSPFYRSWRWCRRNPWIAALVVTAVLLLASLDIGSSLRLLSDREEQALAANVRTATSVARTMRERLDRLSIAVVEASRHDELKELLAPDETREPNVRRQRLQAFVEETHAFYADPFHGFVSPDEPELFASWFILDAQGSIVARSPQFIERDFRWRDYFQGARGLVPAKSGNRPSVYVSRAYRAELDDLYKFAISAPVRDEQDPGRLLGVVVASITTESTLGTLLPQGGRLEAVLVGVLDASGPPGPAPDRQSPGSVILGHPTFSHGDPAVPVDNHILTEVQEGRLDPEDSYDVDYIDPVYRELRLAGFARVADTDFVVVVQQRYDQAVRPLPVYARLLFLWGSLAFCPLVIIFGTTLLETLRRATMKRNS